MNVAELRCNDSFSERGVTCPVCGANEATVTYLVWRGPGGTREDSVIDFDCGNLCWRPWGASNDLIDHTFRRSVA